MVKSSVHFEFEVFDSIDQLDAADKDLLLSARKVTEKAYAPYSDFLVGAVAKLSNGEMVSGTNQENASYRRYMCRKSIIGFSGNAASQCASFYNGHCLSQFKWSKR